MKEIKIGMYSTAETTVSAENLASTVGSGSLEVFATPMMTALMEKAAAAAVADAMENDETTVGTMLNIVHTSATPVGLKVSAYAEVTEINGREITFKVTAEDEKGEIGNGTHKRFVVFGQKFMDKTNSKKQ